MKVFPTIFILVILCSFTLSGCNQIQVPEYPGAIEDQEHEAKYFGLTFGKVRKVVTDDSYDTVLAYYRDLLEVHNPEITSYTLEDGRQTAIKITKSVTVAIQEFKKERKTAIIYMNSGSDGVGWFSLFTTWFLGLLFH
jgi:hypothetical protein